MPAARPARLCLTLPLLPVLAWPLLAQALPAAVARPFAPEPPAVASACEGRLWLEELPGEGGLRLVNRSDQAIAWRLADAPRLEVLRGGASARLDAPGWPARVICR